ncbi:MAG: hypothetical protein ACT4PW_00360 [Acidimicrobiia bacterium]
MVYGDYGTYDIELYDGDNANGVSSILQTLLSQNFYNFPSRILIARRMPRPVAVYSFDAEDSSTLVFGMNKCTIYNGIVGRPSVIVKATVDQILDVSQLKMYFSGLIPLGLLGTKRGYDVLWEIAKHKLVVKGLILHPVTALQFIGLVSIVP